jgi:hypothetical protein
MTPFIAHLLPAVALGLCVAIPFGPIGLMCVQRTLAFGICLGLRAAWERQQPTACSVAWPW